MSLIFLSIRIYFQGQHIFFKKKAVRKPLVTGILRSSSSAGLWPVHWAKSWKKNYDGKSLLDNAPNQFGCLEHYSKEISLNCTFFRIWALTVSQVFEDQTEDTFSLERFTDNCLPQKEKKVYQEVMVML